MGYEQRINQAVNQLHDDLNRQRRRIEELETQLAAAVNGHLPEIQHLDPSMIQVASLISGTTGQPKIILRWFTHYAQLEADAARGLAFQLLEVIEAAKSDAFILSFMRQKAGLSEEKAVRVLTDFRAFREKEDNDDQHIPPSAGA